MHLQEVFRTAVSRCITLVATQSRRTWGLTSSSPPLASPPPAPPAGGAEGAAVDYMDLSVAVQPNLSRTASKPHPIHIETTWEYHATLIRNSREPHRNLIRTSCELLPSLVGTTSEPHPNLI
eukprot:gene9187-biopygen4685